MKCPNCGYEARGPFCSRCGARVVSAGPATQETQHFRIHYPRQSLAEQSLELIESRLESACGATREVLGIDAAGEMIDVFLTELVVEYEGQRLSGGGYAIPGRMQIHDVYRADSPGESLERSVVVLLLAQAAGHDLQPPPLVVDGLLSLVMQRLGFFEGEREMLPVLGEAKVRQELPPVQALLAGPGPASRAIYYPVAASFTAFLLKTHGAAKLRDFVARFDPAKPDEAARAVYRQSWAQLEKDWSKTIKVGKPSGTLRFIKLSWTYLRPYKTQVTEVVIYIGLAVAFGIGMAKVQQFLLDKALIPRDTHALLTIMVILVASFVVVSITSLRQSYLTAWVSESVLKEMRLRMFALIQRLHPGFFQTTRTGDIMSRMTSDMAAIQNAMTGSMAQGLRMMLTLIAAVVTILVTDWKLALIGLAGMPLFFVSTRWLGPAAARASRARQQELAGSTSSLQENLSAQMLVKAFGLQNRMIAEYDRDLSALFRASIRLTYLAGLFGLSANSVATAINLVVMGVGAWLVIGGHLTVGTLFAFLALMAQVIGPVQNISGITQGFQQATGAMDRVEEMLRVEPEIKDAPNATPIAPLARTIQLENVTFGYNPGEPTLQDLNLVIPAGSSVALVGPSGCGKSTILNLVMRFYDPTGGRVLFDGVDIREATVDSVRNQIGVVFQDSVLFNISIRENIRLGKLDATDAEVENAARAAEIHELIMRLPDGYDTTVGERGGRLSGGQRQRMAIARAIIRNPPILILDEATSALDPLTEAAINETLTRIGQGRTTISVTHRIASVVHADRIFVLDRGRLVESGTHEELLQAGGLFAHLWQEQGGALGDGRPRGVDLSHLRNVPIFAGLEAPALGQVAARLTPERFAPGETILRMGDVGDKMYIVQRGQVEVLAADPAMQLRPLAALREGDYFGEMALLRDAPRAATVRARTPVEAYSLGKDNLLALLQGNPALRGAMEEVVVARARELMPQGTPATRPAPTSA